MVKCSENMDETSGGHGLHSGKHEHLVLSSPRETEMSRGSGEARGRSGPWEGFAALPSLQCTIFPAREGQSHADKRDFPKEDSAVPPLFGIPIQLIFIRLLDKSTPSVFHYGEHLKLHLYKITFTQTSIKFQA